MGNKQFEDYLGTKPRVYIKSPVAVFAIQWDGTANQANEIINWILNSGASASFYCTGDERCRKDSHDIAINTLEGRMIASPNDYIIKGVQGEFYPCKPDIFEATYEDPREIENG